MPGLISDLRGQADAAWAAVCAGLGIGDGEAKAQVRRLLQALRSDEPLRGYGALPRAFFDSTRSAVLESASPQRWRILDLILVELVRQFDRNFGQAGLPESLLPDYLENIDRMLQRAVRPNAWAQAVNDDIFLKDLGILRMTLIPCASHLIFRNSGVPRRLMLRQRPADAARALGYLLLRCGGFEPFMENHVHPAMLAHFNAAGRERCYRLVAQLLQRWPDSRGLMGLSWYYDPAVAAISPRLAYLREVPERAGALFLPAGDGEDVVRGATATSATRRRLYDAGTYVPRRYLMAWSRQGLLEHCDD